MAQQKILKVAEIFVWVLGYILLIVFILFLIVAISTFGLDILGDTTGWFETGLASCSG